ncbi:MAG: hypothetical protein HC880_10590 [Bacteroidia bacterium]|nr:hypothetical protein [Bacteroidia bacterium]
MLGEVNRPGHYPIFNDQVTLFEALSLAGDLKEFANARQIKLIRQKPEGVAVVLLDITDDDILMSPYYYLLPNDILYVEPLKAQVRRTNLPLLGAVFSGVSTLVLLLNFIAD